MQPVEDKVVLMVTGEIGNENDIDRSAAAVTIQPPAFSLGVIGSGNTLKCVYKFSIGWVKDK